MIYTFDNFYTEKELDCIWKELEFYTSLPKKNRERAEVTSVATDANGNSLGKSDRIYVNDIFTNYGKIYSHINNLSYKIIDDHAEAIEMHLPNGVQITDQNTIHNMVSYYGPNDYYDTHHDVFQFTCLIWLYKEPKKFSGGDMYFESLNKHYECKNNRLIVFPSYLKHKVEKIIMSQKDFDNGYGRYTITHFLHHAPLKES